MTQEQKQKVINMWLCGMSIEQIRKIMPVKTTDFKETIKEMKRTGEFPTHREGKIKSVVQMYKDGKTDPYEIASELGISYSTLRSYKSLLGIKTGRQKHNFKHCKKTKQLIKELKIDEKTISQIAKEYGVSRQYVSKLKQRMEI